MNVVIPKAKNIHVIWAEYNFNNFINEQYYVLINYEVININNDLF